MAAVNGFVYGVCEKNNSTRPAEGNFGLLKVTPVKRITCMSTKGNLLRDSNIGTTPIKGFRKTFQDKTVRAMEIICTINSTAELECKSQSNYTVANCPDASHHVQQEQVKPTCKQARPVYCKSKYIVAVNLLPALEVSATAFALTPRFRAEILKYRQAATAAKAVQRNFIVRRGENCQHAGKRMLASHWPRCLASYLNASKLREIRTTCCRVRQPRQNFFFKVSRTGSLCHASYRPCTRLAAYAGCQRTLLTLCTTKSLSSKRKKRSPVLIACSLHHTM
ncbi:hypothetical protein NPIL_53311 [Nephila pilipes]|uniref:Uncharacterized protein n=1 Tax=Nephila pilipes TaxID=299642 RepID=A0A8X6TLT6_NEPPI|nr:hypothetical protein NPIL_53311 [Nephila pilipes]